MQAGHSPSRTPDRGGEIVALEKRVKALEESLLSKQDFIKGIQEVKKELKELIELHFEKK